MNKGVSFFIVIARERSDRDNLVVKRRSDCIVARTPIFGYTLPLKRERWHA